MVMDALLSENDQDCENKDDLISGLPDVVLAQILSFLPSKVAARTSVLARRWKDVWRCVPDIELTCHPDQSASESMAFFATVNHVLSHRTTAQIRKFKLSFYSAGVTELYCIYCWIQHAIWRKVREIDLNVMDVRPFMLPPELFTCKTLVSLKLQSGLTFCVPSLIEFPSLKVLHVIGNVTEEIAERLFSCCPVLEELLIEGYKEDHVAFTAKLVVKSLSSVIDAYICLGNCFGRPGGHKPDYSEYVYQLFREISQVQILTLSAITMFTIRFALHQNLSPFPNLIELSLNVEHCEDWQFLPVLLNNLPNLRSLNLQKNTLCDHERDYDWCSPESVPQCLLSTLMYVYFQGLNMREDELKMIEFLLKNGEVLKQLTVMPIHLALEDAEVLANRLVMLPRASESCDVECCKDYCTSP
ncbi:LOW QUALITY PROTEIN: putative F-box/FBD/LRR-repeat protein At1g66290 [Pistacia vera]|uniref:LOW QUALITY PROTEIN: putative F-box/FBD/LRR-repeat protein At1g66290 n=1 Tax=Pistacia vera TaxID=55513 RepID=UPI001262DC99|nr:LOW QUALITY PROTEIN: putative F-box/FBD/LRR-repeat protein At1g66290 [Pistacia vera]